MAEIYYDIKDRDATPKTPKGKKKDRIDHRKIREVSDDFVSFAAALLSCGGKIMGVRLVLTNFSDCCGF